MRYTEMGTLDDGSQLLNCLSVDLYTNVSIGVSKIRHRDDDGDAEALK